MSATAWRSVSGGSEEGGGRGAILGPAWLFGKSVALKSSQEKQRETMRRARGEERKVINQEGGSARGTVIS